MICYDKNLVLLMTLSPEVQNVVPSLLGEATTLQNITKRKQVMFIQSYSCELYISTDATIDHGYNFIFLQFFLHIPNWPKTRATAITYENGCNGSEAELGELLAEY